MHLVLMSAAVLVLAFCGGDKGKSDSGPTPPSRTGQISDEEALPLLTTYCVGCHSGDAPKAGVKLDTTIDAKRFSTRSVEVLDAKEMPPSRARNQPSDDERTKLSKWFKD